jgi:hypothetical protein
VEQERLKNAAEIASNIAVVLVAIAVLSFAIAFFWMPAKPKVIAGLEKGKQFSVLRNVDYRSTEQTLLIALNTDCSYCQESVPLYRKVMDAYPRGNLTKDHIEAEADALLVSYSQEFGTVTRPPIPADEILNTHLKVNLDLMIFQNYWERTRTFLAQRGWNDGK